MVDACTGRLKELKAKPTTSTWFKDHLKVFYDENQLGGQNVTIAEAEKECFMSDIYQPYVQSVIDHISSRMQSTDLTSAFSVFDKRHLPGEEKDLAKLLQ